MNEEILIYVAGNPDLYPLEYYDTKTHTYQGSIPRMLERFAEEYGYRIEYYLPGAEDTREDLAGNEQVDIISGCVRNEEDFENIREVLTLLEADEEGEQTAYQLLLTKVAPESLGEDLKSFVSQISSEEWNGLLIEASVTGKTGPYQEPVMIGLGVLVGMLLIGIAVVSFLFRQRVLREEQIRYRDPLTGLPNQEYLKKVFPRMVHEKNRILCYMLYFRLDMTHVERLGGQVHTEDFLVHAVKVLTGNVPKEYLLVREANGDFIVLMQAQRIESVEEWARKTIREIQDFTYGGGGIRASDVGVGLCPLQDGALVLADLLFQARRCAIEACEEETDLYICDEKERKACAEERRVFADFEQGLSREEFQSYLQPFVDAKTHDLVGGEMLIRWNHPQKGFLSPGAFVPLLEREDRIEKLDFFNLEQTCAFLSQTQEKESEDFFISCNFSRKTICQENFVQRCQEIIEQYDFCKKRLVLEITESRQEKDKDQSQMFWNIKTMRELGVRVVFDDFGIGFSSFHDLQDYPMDGLKLDKHLVENMETEQGRAILRSLIQTGHELKMMILAEGVEDLSQAEALKALGCDVLQGFYFSPPLPQIEAKRMLKRSREKQKGKADVEQKL